jgi:molybdopterin molybdotransferase
MDGFAVRAADTFGASPSLPAYLTQVGSVAMGAVPELSVETGQTVEIQTGGMLPEGADAVVMVERTHCLSGNEIEVLAPVAPGENLVERGEDVPQGEVILPAGHRIRPQDLGGLLAVGTLEVEVAVLPRISILSCGDELVPPEATPAPGQIRDINSYTLKALLEEAGAEVTLLGIVRDNLDEFFRLAHSGLAQSDMLVMTAGSSVSTRDLTRQVIQRLGSPGILQHGLAIKPGKPTIIAVCDNKPVVGLPGNPVSALLVARCIVVPVVKRFLGEATALLSFVRATLSSNIPSASGREDFVPVRFLQLDGKVVAEPVFGKSNLIFTLANANGLVHVPLDATGLKSGTEINVTLF